MKDRWDALSDDEKHVWKEWQTWDKKRYEHQSDVYDTKHSKAKKTKKKKDSMSVPKKAKMENFASIPKKRS